MPVRITPDHLIVDRHGKPEAVILSFANYQRLLKQADDREDARLLRRAVRGSHRLISHDELLQRLKRPRPL